MKKPTRKQLERGMLWKGLGCTAGCLLMVWFMLLSWPQVIRAQDNQEPIGLPVITGEARAGETLTADTSGISDPDGPDPIPISYFTYQWLADDAAITGATERTYTLTDSEQGKSIAVRVTYDDYEFSREELTSASKTVSWKPLGSPVITGEARAGETLTAGTSGISDPDGPDSLTFTYQWLADDAAITGATERTYTLTDNEQGKSIAVRVSFTDDQGHSETITSAAMSVNQAPIGLPIPRRDVWVGGTLIADTSEISDPDGPSPLTFTYQWLVDDVEIVGAISSTYQLTTNEVGKRIQVRVSFTDGLGHSETITSAATTFENQAPTGLPFLRGSPRAGETLTADTSEVLDPDGPSPLTFTYQWLADDVEIAGAISRKYQLTTNEVGKRIQVRVSFTDSIGFVTTVDSAATKSVGAEPSNGDLRLREVGVLELYFSGRWGSVIDDAESFGRQEAKVACVQLGYADGEVKNYDPDYKTIIPIWVDGVVCAGTESRLLDCRHTFFEDQDNIPHDHRNDVLLNCSSTPSNIGATGEPVITGRIRVGDTLTVDTSGISDPEGDTLTFTYEWWSRHGGALSGVTSTDTVIVGATDSTYVLMPSDQGRRILVKVTVTDEGNNTVTFWTDRTSRVDYAMEENSPPLLFDVRIQGVPWMFQTLGAIGRITDRDNVHVTPLEWEDTQDGTFEAALETFGSFLEGLAVVINNPGHYVPLTFNYQWLADDAEITGATSRTYQLTANEVGKRIKVRVTYTDEGGTPEEVIIDHPNMVVGPTLVLTGLKRVGEELSVEPDFVFPEPLLDVGQATLLTLTYQWLADAVPIDGATEATYTLTTAEEGKRITVRVSFTDTGNHRETLTSDATEAVAAEAVTANQVPTGSPTITGTAQVGEALSVDTSGIADADGPEMPTFSYQWLADAVQIDEATEATYTPEVADAGKRITVEVSFTDDGSTTEELTSEPTEAVVARQMAVSEVSVSYTGGAYTATEGGGGAVVRLTLSPDPERTVEIPIVATTASTATDSDYTISPMTVTFANGETSKDVTVLAVDDAIDEDDESVTLGFGTLPNGVSKIQGTDTAEVTLRDNDERGVVVSLERLRVTEGNSEDYTVVLRSEPTAAVTVQVTTDLAGTDLTVNPTSLTFTADNWSVAQTVKVSAAEDDDALDEAEVVLSHAVSGGDYGAETADPVTVTVLENDTAMLAIAGDEKSESRGTLDFVVSLRPASSKVVTVAYATADDTALAGSDYTAVEGTLTFAAGAAASQTIAVTLIDDTVDESETETFTVTLSDAAHATLDGASAVGTIMDDDDPAVTVSFAEGQFMATEGGGAALVTLSLSADPEREVAVPLTVTASGGASADDYTVSETTLTFAGGETTKQVTVAAVNDAVDEDDERVTLGFGELPERVTAGEVRTVAVTLADNDERGVVVSKTALTVSEGGSASYTVVLESEPTAAVTIEVTGHAGTELTVSPTRLTFTAMDWAVAQTVAVSAAEDDDTLADPEVVLSHAVNGGDYAGETADDVTVTVLENDAPTLAIVDAQGLEDVGTLSFEVSLSTASSEAVTVAYATEDATALAGSDYTAAAGTLTFAAGSTASQTLTVAITDDDADEPESETFTVVLSNAANAELGDASAVGTILDNDDPAVTVSFGALNGTATEGGGAALVTLSLSADPEREVAVPLMVTAGGGASADDYTVSETMLTFAGGETTKQVTVAAVDDAVDDDGESVELGFEELPERVTAGEVRTVAVTLADNDERGVVVSPERLTVREGGSASYTVVLGSEPTAAVTVEVTGHAGTDLTVSPTSLTFTAMDWAVAQTVAVSAAEDDDTLADPEVVLSHAVSGGDYADETADGVTVTVLENDAPTLAIADAQDLEDVGTLSFVVSLSTASNKTVTVAYATEDGTALAGSDYTAVEGTLTFAPGSTAPQPIAVSITDDTVDESETETFTVVLSNATNATLGDASAVGTILDNDVAVVQNASPVLVGALDEQALQVGGESVEVGVSEAFRDADGDALRYTAASSDRSVAVAVVSGATVTVTPVGVGLATVTVRATDTADASMVQTFEVTVTLVLMEENLRVKPNAEGDTVVVYEVPTGPTVEIEISAEADGSSLLDTDGDGDVDGEDVVPMVRRVSASEVPAVDSELRLRVDTESAVDIELPERRVGSLSSATVRVCLATRLSGDKEILSLYRYDGEAEQWQRLASEVEDRDDRRFVCALVSDFSVFAVVEELDGAVSADVNGDGALDGDDALVMYYAYELGDLLGDGDSGGVARFRQTLLAGLSGGPSPSDGALMEMLRKSQAWRASGVDAGGDVNGDAMIDMDDALLMYYAYELGGLLGDGDSGGVARFRQTLLAGPSGQPAPSDAKLMEILRNANRLREEP